MKTDELFYELFKIDPHSLFRLVQLPLEGDYTFESITIKTTEKRLDGFWQRTDGVGPRVFAEFQGYDDAMIYWRAFREVFTYQEQTRAAAPFVLIILFLDEKYDPGDCPVMQVAPPHHFLRAMLKPCLEAVGEQAGALTVLKPLLCDDTTQVAAEIPAWTAEIQSLPLPAEQTCALLELLEYLIVQRFPTMSRKELETMLHLTPFEETTIGRELKHLWTMEGRREGMNKGKLIGAIQTTQRFLHRPVSSPQELGHKSVTALKAMLQELEAELAVLK